MIKRNGKGIWLREIEKTLKRFDASLEWLMERIGVRDDEMEKIRRDDQMAESEKAEMLRAQKLKNIDEVLEEVGVLIDTHFFNEFTETKSSKFLKNVIASQSLVETGLLKKTWRTLNCTRRR